MTTGSDSPATPPPGRPSPPPGPIRVFLVDDHRLFLSGVRAELADRADVPVEIVGEAVDVESAVEGIRRTAPDVVLLDVHLPGGGGRAVIETVRARQPGVVFLALSVSDAAEDVIAVIRAGARGYVTKTISSDDLAAALVRVRDGDAVFSPRLAGFVLDAFAGNLPAGFAGDPELDQITPRSARCCGCWPAGTRTRRSPAGSSCRSRRSRATPPRCCASSSCRAATS